MTTDAITVLAEDHFGGSLALWAAVASTILPLVYVIGLLVVGRRLGKKPTAGLVASGLLTLGFALALVPFWARHLVGQDEVGVVRGSETQSRRPGSVTVYKIELDDGRILDESVEHEDDALMTVGQSVRVRAVRGMKGFERLGDRATLSEGTIFGSLIAWSLLALISIAFSRAKPKPDRGG
jgi:hypothetical protein